MRTHHDLDPESAAVARAEQSRAEQGRARVEGLRDVDSQRLLAWLPREQGVTTGIVGHYRPPDGK